MAAKTKDTAAEQQDSLTTAVVKEEPKYKGPMVDIFLPEREGSGDGFKVDQYEHVTIANEEREQHFRIHRGEHVQVPVPVFLTLKEKYPKL